jgi:hypothetical protein
VASRGVGEEVVAADDPQREGIASDLDQVQPEQRRGAAGLAADRGGDDLAVMALPARQRAGELRGGGVAGQGPQVNGREGEGGIIFDGAAQGAARVAWRERLALREAVPPGGEGRRGQGALVGVVRFHCPSIDSPADPALMSDAHQVGERGNIGLVEVLAE